ncbi:MAG: mechanosensitive ion channel domain-containing protein [Pseudomonadota bacterium]
MYCRFFTLITLVIAWSVNAQDIQSVSRDIERLQADISVDEETRTEAINLLTNARDVLVRADERASAVRGFAATAATAEQTQRQIRVDLEALQNEQVADVPASISVEELNRSLTELTAESVAVDAEIGAAREREAALGSRAEEIAGEIATARSDLAGLIDNPPAEEPSANAVADANKILYASRVLERRAAIDDLAEERTTLATRQEIVAASLNLALAQQAKLAELISRTQDRLGTFRIATATDILTDVEQQMLEFSGALPVLRDYAQENLDLARTNLVMVNGYTPLAIDTVRLEQDLSRLTTSAQTVDQVFATGQLNDETAALLRDVLNRLPGKEQLARTMSDADQTSATLRLNQVLWQDRLRNIADSGEVMNRLFAGVNVADLAAAQESAAVLIRQRRILLEALSDSARDNTNQMGAQRLLRQDILQRTTDLVTLLDRRLLWLPTNSGDDNAFVPNLVSNIAWIMSPSGWGAAGRAVLSGFRTAGTGPAIIGALALILGFFARTFRKRLELIGGRVGRVDVDTYLTTPEAFGLSLLLALPVALGIGAIGWAATHANNDVFANASGEGVLALAAVVFILLYVRVLGRSDGVFHRHFGWSNAARRKLRFNLNWFIPVQAIGAFLFTAALASGDLVIKYGIGRLAFMMSAIAIALFAFNALKPRDGIVMSIDARRRFSTAMKLLFVVLIAAPLIFGFLPAIGYFEAAIELQTRIFDSATVILLAAVLYRLLLRTLMVGQRRLLVKQTLEQIERQQAERENDTGIDESGDASPKDKEEDLTDLDLVARQSRQAIFVVAIIVLIIGLWRIWGPLLPALGIADEIVLWQGTSLVDGVATSMPVSLWDVTVSLLLIAGGFVVARNIAGILELIVFERFALAAGTRYAVITIAKYVLVSVGLVTGLSRLGLDWGSLQWVVAALGVGLGFGLQEIVANFVSGLIILFERPIRVGDIVSIGQLEGTVTSIQIRATRITDFDNREVLLPNKSIITENVTNWTLNDQVTRIVLKIGVAYGSDIDLVRDLILDVVSQHPEALPTPAPAVFFMAHGESSLNFEARVFVATPARRFPTMHDLNRNISLALEAHGIDIPFIQRELHPRSMQNAAALAASASLPAPAST